MTLEQKINEDIKSAMLSKEREKLDALRAVKSALLLLKTEKGGDGTIIEDAEIKLLQRLVKQRKESAELYKTQDRPDLAAEEELQIAIISKYLPEQISDEDILLAIKALIAENNIENIKDMGRLMGIASKQLYGKADNKRISEIVKQILS